MRIRRSDDIQTTTVAELIATLRNMPQDAIVQIEGCDCIGCASGDVDDDEMPAFLAERYGVSASRRTVCIRRGEP